MAVADRTTPRHPHTHRATTAPTAATPTHSLALLAERARIVRVAEVEHDVRLARGERLEHDKQRRIDEYTLVFKTPNHHVPCHLYTPTSSTATDAGEPVGQSASSPILSDDDFFDDFDEFEEEEKEEEEGADDLRGPGSGYTEKFMSSVAPSSSVGTGA